jgi:hypothetical protein
LLQRNWSEEHLACAWSITSLAPTLFTLDVVVASTAEVVVVVGASQISNKVVTSFVKPFYFKI